MKFKKKPVIIEAVQYIRRFDWPMWFHDAVTRKDITVFNTGKSSDPTAPCYANIHTLEGIMLAKEGDWIVRGIAGELYSCKPDIFEKTYEPVSEEGL